MRKILLSTNGIAAVKGMRSIRRWAYDTFGREDIFTFIQMTTNEDIQANAEYVHMADILEVVDGGSNVNNFANVRVIVRCAQKHAVDAVWAGWGHASENPRLPEMLSKLGIGFMGPGAQAMRALGDKIGSTLIAQSVGVSVLPWSGDSLRVQYKTEEIPDEIFQKASVLSAAQACAEAARIGYPVMVKASEGGGGKGIRKVLSAESMQASFEQVISEVPGSPVFVVKLAPPCRHLEVQLIADMHGQVVPLFGRDCSVQRRHQKIIEEGPVVAAPADVRQAMMKAAVRLAEEVGYTSAGTVEYLYTVNYADTPSDEVNKYYFLELNPRLQVEHPVTELITGVNLPALQLQVCMGVPLHRIPEIRRLYGESETGDSRIDFSDLTRLVEPHAYVIAARITAENADAGFKPTSGTVSDINFRNNPSVWGYFSIHSSGGVHEFSDSQFGHIFALSRTSRNDARRNMVTALKDLEIHGNIRTTVEYLIFLLETPEFNANQITTDWLDGLIAGKVRPVPQEPDVVVCCSGLVLTHQKFHERIKESHDCITRGVVPASHLLETDCEVEFVWEGDCFNMSAEMLSYSSYRLELNGSHLTGEVRTLSDGGYVINLGHHTHVVYTKDDVEGKVLLVNGRHVLLPRANNPSEIRSPTAGKLRRRMVRDGALLEKGQVFAEVEVMKMCSYLTTEYPGVISFCVGDGAAFHAGALLANLALSDPSSVLVPPPTKYTFNPPSPAVTVLQTPPTTPRATPDDTPTVGWLGGATTSTASSSQLRSSLVDVHQAYLAELEGLFRILEGFASNPTLGGPDRFMCHARSPVTALSVLEDAVNRITASVSLQNAHKSELRDVNSLFDDACHEFSVHKGQQVIDELLVREGERPSVVVVNETEHALWPVVETLSKDLLMLLEGFPEEEDVVRLRQLCDHVSDSDRSFGAYTLGLVIRKYLQVEDDVFGRFTSPETAMYALRVAKFTTAQLHTILMSHNAADRKNATMVHLLQGVSVASLEYLSPLLARLAVLHHPEASAVAILSARILHIGNTPSWQGRCDEALRSAQACALRPRMSRSRGIVQIGGKSKTAYVFTGLGEEADIALRPLAPDLVNFSARELGGVETEALLLMIAGEGVDPAHPLAAYLRATAGIAYLSTLQKQIHSLPTVDGIMWRCAISKTGALYVAWQLEEAQPPVASTTPQNVLEHLAAVVGISDGLLVFARTIQGCFEAWEAMSAVKSSGEEELVPVHLERAGHVIFVAYSDDQPVSDSAHKVSVHHSISATLHHMTPAPQHLPLSIAAHAKSLAAKNVRLVTCLDLSYPALIRSLATFDVTPLGEKPPAPARALRYFDRAEPHWHKPLQSWRMSKYEWSLLGQHPAGDARSQGRLFVFLLSRGTQERRVFVRSTHWVTISGLTSFSDEIPEGVVGGDPLGPTGVLEQALGRCKQELAAALKGRRDSPAGNTIFCRVSTNLPVSRLGKKALHRSVFKQVQNVVTSTDFARLSLEFVEIQITGKAPEDDDTDKQRVTLVVTNPTGQKATLRVWQSFSNEPAPAWVDAPYHHLGTLDLKRHAAFRANTTYAYDFLTLFATALDRSFRRDAQKFTPQDDANPGLMHAYEIVTSDGGRKGSNAPPEPLHTTHTMDPAPEIPEQISKALEAHGLTVVNRMPGHNTMAMVAWLVWLRTPEYPTTGRWIVLIANDMTVSNGTFGVPEGNLFSAAVRCATDTGVPFVHLSANSGARIELHSALMNEFKVEFKGGSSSNGVDYLYLDPEAYERVGPSCVLCDRVQGPNGEDRYRILSVLGDSTSVLGVRNLSSSGRLAGDMSAAYSRTFTLTYVCGNAVGIGAYLVRLGQRSIQNVRHPLLLTGYKALNSLLNQSLYTSNLQLGGPNIMYANGVSHQTVDNDLDGVASILKWLSFVPDYRGASLPLLPTLSGDDLEREVGVQVGAGEGYEVRTLLCGVNDAIEQSEVTSFVSDAPPQSTGDNGAWVGGLLDRGSFVECLGGWAQTVVTGRGRLGGLPVGVICVSALPNLKRTPADPADRDSKELEEKQSPFVWYPDSSFKTATAITDFTRDGLPILILANWRGFSGGTRDMYTEVLKFGSMIVDALRACDQPVLVYLPKHAELRGGAWVVLDSQINPGSIEMYAEPTARAGVLEPAGAVEIVFRGPARDKLVLRCDPVAAKLQSQLSQQRQQRQAIEEQLKARCAEVARDYVVAAEVFAALHDTATHMQSIGCVRAVVPWANARKFLGTRLRRLVAERQLAGRMGRVDGGAEKGQLNKWRQEDGFASQEAAPRDIDSLMRDDVRFVEWSSIKAREIEHRVLEWRRSQAEQELALLRQTFQLS